MPDIRNKTAREILIPIEKKRHVSLAPFGDLGDTLFFRDEALLPDRDGNTVLEDLILSGHVEIVSSTWDDSGISSGVAQGEFNASLLGKISTVPGAVLGNLPKFDASGSLVDSGVSVTTIVTDHGALTGKGDDDHAQYALLLGRSGGQTLIGGTAASDELLLKGTSHATPGKVVLQDDMIVIRPPVAIPGTDEMQFKYVAGTKSGTITLPNLAGGTNLTFVVGGNAQLKIERVGATDIVDCVVDKRATLGSDVVRWHSLYVENILSKASALDTAGANIYLTAPAGGTHVASNPGGGSFVVEPGAAGSGGSGPDGRLVLLAPGGTLGVNQLDFSHSGTNCTIRSNPSGLAGNVTITVGGQGFFNLERTGAVDNVSCVVSDRATLGTSGIRWKTLYVEAVTQSVVAADTSGNDLTLGGTELNAGVNGGANPRGGDVLVKPGAGDGGRDGIAKIFSDAELVGSLLLAGGSTTHYLESTDGSTAALSAAGRGRMRYNNTAKKWQVSVDGGAYVDLSTGAGATPGGVDTQVQFNDGGSFGGNAGLVFTKATGILGANFFNALGSSGFTTPIIYLNSDTDTGISYSAANQWSLVAGGTELVRLHPTNGIQCVRTGTVAAPAIRLISDVGLTGEGGVGRLVAGGSERFRWNVTGISFFGGGQTAKQTVTGSRGANAALASLLTALAAYSFITDSTTA